MIARRVGDLEVEQVVSFAGKETLLLETNRAMHGRDEFPDRTMVDGQIFIRRVRCADLQGIMEIERQSFQNPWSWQLFADLVMASSGGSVLFNVAVRGDRVIGYAIAEIVGPELHLTNLAVAAEYRKGGIGSKLTTLLEVWGRQKGGEEVWLEVREHNSAAIRFYGNLGYQIRGRRKGYYCHPREDAFLMSKLLIESKD